MISIHTRTNRIYHPEYWRHFLAKNILGKQRGPHSVLASLERGLQEIGEPYALNPKSLKETALVLSGPKGLEDVIGKKRDELVKKLVAGPNVVIHPNDSQGIIKHELIDVVLVPSEWTANFWKHEAPDIAHKIRIWPAGVQVAEPSTRSGSPIIYDKIGDEKLVDQILKQLGNCTVFKYGNFQRRDFIKALKQAPFMVYLSRSESQGLALHEAWAHDVPVLVNNSEVWEYRGHSWHASLINAPYLTAETGLVFNEPDSITGLLPTLAKLHPKAYSDEYYSDKAAAHKLLEILQS